MFLHVSAVAFASFLMQNFFQWCSVLSQFYLFSMLKCKSFFLENFIRSTTFKMRLWVQLSHADLLQCEHYFNDAYINILVVILFFSVQDMDLKCRVFHTPYFFQISSFFLQKFWWSNPKFKHNSLNFSAELIKFVIWTRQISCVVDWSR